MLDTRNRSKTEDYPKSIPISQRRRTLGPLIMNDSFMPESTRKLIHKLLKCLSDENFCKNTGFREALYRNVEIHKLFRPVMDLSYYLSFSGMEILARHWCDDFETNNVASVIAPFLTDLNFQITQEKLQEFANVRNALFHHGKYKVSVNINGQAKVYKLINYATDLEMLLCDTLLKVAKFDDGTINWNRWQDRQPFT